MGAAIFAIIILAIFVPILIKEVYKQVRYNAKEAASKRNIAEREATKPQRIEKNSKQISDLYLTEVTQREALRNANPVLEVDDYFNEKKELDRLEGLSKKEKSDLFAKKYKTQAVYKFNVNDSDEQDLSPSKRDYMNNSLEFIGNKFHVKGTLISKAFGWTGSYWLTSEEHNLRREKNQFLNGTGGGDAWELIIKTKTGDYAAILFNFESRSEEAKAQSKYFEDMQPGIQVEATGIMSIANNMKNFKPEVPREKANEYAYHIYRDDIHTIRAKLGEIITH